MKRSWIFWNMIILVLTLLAIYSFSNQAYSMFKLFTKLDYLEKVANNNLLNTIELVKETGIVHPDIPQPDLSIKRFIIETLMFNITLMPLIFFMIFLVHCGIIGFVNLEEIYKEKSDFSDFRLYHYFFIFVNPITYYALIVYYVIPKIFKIGYNSIINFNNYLDKK